MSLTVAVAVAVNDHVNVNVNDHDHDHDAAHDLHVLSSSQVRMAPMEKDLATLRTRPSHREGHMAALQAAI